eukprot:TRINITY_DN2489_c0_g4_i2.p1 TRINITY_DN2489_c0_g4~~TRINITY_DN2489_c0_g4_i2.p1  ORF type:complete len:543 (+),score=183.22 TRINITY_DN2489_c0_g4_i2:83-1711(+)
MCIRDRYQRRVHGERLLLNSLKMKTLAITLLLLNVAFLASADNWAVLVAGSNDFWNYRHQSDVCHAYQILIKNGFNPDNVIVFSYNDVATSSENPFPNQLYNKPTPKGVPGVDNNKGCKIDYEGDDNNPENFLAVLRGDAAAVKGGNGKVLKSTTNDKVFINFADHGATGLIAFPNSYLYANDLLKTLKYMTDNNLYQELVFYLEACESGSMFQKLPKNTKIYATSAASPDESSWATYCEPDDEVNGVSIGSCLGDLYSVNWMEDTDKGNLEESLHEQFNIVKKLTDQSQVMEWGDQSFNTEKIGNFLSAGRHPTEKENLKGIVHKLLGRVDEKLVKKEIKKVNSRDVKLHYLMSKHLKRNSVDTMNAVRSEIWERDLHDMRFAQLKKSFDYPFDILTKPVEVNDFDCLKRAVRAYEKCNKLGEYGLKYVKALANICEFKRHTPADVERMILENCDPRDNYQNAEGAPNDAQLLSVPSGQAIVQFAFADLSMCVGRSMFISSCVDNIFDQITYVYTSFKYKSLCITAQTFLQRHTNLKKVDK